MCKIPEFSFNVYLDTGSYSCDLHFPSVLFDYDKFFLNLVWSFIMVIVNRFVIGRFNKHLQSHLKIHFHLVMSGWFDGSTSDTLEVSHVEWDTGPSPVNTHTPSLRVGAKCHSRAAFLFPCGHESGREECLDSQRRLWNTFSHGHWSAPDVLIWCTLMLQFTRAELLYWHYSQSEPQCQQPRWWPWTAYYTPWQECVCRALPLPLTLQCFIWYLPQVG